MKRLAILLFLSLSCAPAHGGVLFQDDFTGGKSPKWIQTNDGPGRGTFRVSGGRYIIDSSDPAAELPRALVRSVARNNYFIQADTRIRPLASGLAAASLLSYYTDSNHFYEFAVDVTRQFWSLRKVDKSGSALLAEGAVPGPSRSLFRLGLYVQQNDLRAFIDGVLVTEQLDSRPLSGGAFGLSTQGASTEFDHVVVKTSNPQDFFYSIEAASTDASGYASFSGTRLQVVRDAGQPVAGATLYRIRRDGLSYFIAQDPSGRLAPRSGFLTEFQPAADRAYRITLTAPGTPPRPHTYLPYETDWVLDFVRRTARIVPRGVTAELQATHNLNLRSGAFVERGGVAITDTALGSAGSQAELNQLLFGNWEAFGNYSMFPSTSGMISSTDALMTAAASQSKAPQNSLFSLSSLSLSAGGPTVSIGWLIQEDSRAFVLVDSVTFPSQLRQGGSYTVPFRILNTGEHASAFSFSVVLSRNSFPGATDTVLGRVSFPELDAGGRIDSEIRIQVPAGVPDGLYFLATFLQTPSIRDRLLRVHNGNFVQPVTLGSVPQPGRVSFALNWEGRADLDLHVTDPFGETIYYFHPFSDSGGSLQHDRECNGSSADPEIVSYPAGKAFPGQYQVSVHYFNACGPPRDVSWTVTIDSDQGSSKFTGTAHPGDYLRVTQYTR